MSLDRRDFLLLSALAAAGAAGEPGRRPKIAAILSTCFFRSHAHVFLENFLEPYLFNGQITDPGVDVVSIYVDQFAAKDMARDIAAAYRIPIYPTIRQALELNTSKLAVDAVLSIGEHGEYPTNDRGQTMYPRKRFFDEITAVFRASGRSGPVFNDKHLSFRWDWAREMVDTSRSLGFPLMAGSSVPLAERRPALELPGGVRLSSAIAVHGGGVESYDFHALEVLQSMVEARAGGETGVRAVRFVEKDSFWQTVDAGEWDLNLARSALEPELGPNVPDLRTLLTNGRLGHDPPHAILVEYVDGLKGMALKAGSDGVRWGFACREAGTPKPLFTSFYVGPWQNRNLFRALSHAIQWCFRERRTPYPIERTLLTTGILAAAMESRFQGGGWLQTPHLRFSYAAKDFRSFREMGETWKILTPDVPESPGIDRTASRLRRQGK